MVTESTKKYRDIFAIGLLAVVVLELVVAFALLFKDLGGADFSDKAALSAGDFVSPVLTILVVAAVLLVSHLGGPTKLARPLVFAALGVLGLMVLLGLITWIAGLTSDSVEQFGAFAGFGTAGKVAGTFGFIGYLALVGLAVFFTIQALSGLPAPVKPLPQQQNQWGGQPGGGYQQWGGQPAQPTQSGQPGQQWGGNQPGGQQWGEQSGGQHAPSHDQQWGAAGAGAGAGGYAAGTWGQPETPAEPAQTWGQPETPAEPAQTWGQPETPAEPAPSWGQPDPDVTYDAPSAGNDGLDSTQQFSAVDLPETEPAAEEPQADQQDEGQQHQPGWWNPNNS